jgi:Phage integrase family
MVVSIVVQRRTPCNQYRSWIAPAGAARQRPCPASIKAFRAQQGLRYPPDPPTVEEIVAVMSVAGDAPDGIRLHGVIVVLWRAGLRISEALALNETDLDPDRGALVVRHGKGDKRREVGMDRWDGHTLSRGSSYAGVCRSDDCSACCAVQPVGGRARPLASAASSTAPPKKPACVAGSHRTIKPTCSICRRRRAPRPPVAFHPLPRDE